MLGAGGIGAKSVKSEMPLNMEKLGVAYGFVLYRKRFESGIKGKLDLSKAKDYTVVMVNGEAVARTYEKGSVSHL